MRHSNRRVPGVVGVALLNSSFGYNVTSDFANDDVDTFAIQPGASGTAFAGGPPTLISANATNFFTNTPGTTIYDGDRGVTVFTDNFGDGIVTAVGFDYCCTPPDEPGPILDWYEVMNRALAQCELSEPSGPLVIIPTLSQWGMILTTIILGIFAVIVLRRKSSYTS